MNPMSLKTLKPPHLKPPIPPNKDSSFSKTENSFAGCLRCGKCLGFKIHEWRQSCANCHCFKSDHELSENSFLITLISNDFLNLYKQKSGPIEGYTWMPPGLCSARMLEWIHQLPTEKAPLIGGPGEKYRQIQLAYQLPKQDLSLKHCIHVKDGVERKSYEDYIRNRNNFALDIGHIIENKKTTAIPCVNCKESIQPGALTVVAPRLGLKSHWHPACFTCNTCNELLVDYIYCAHETQLLCQRHYGDAVKARCGACDELIFSGQYTEALNKKWHSFHFCCWHCDSNLTGQKYILTDEHPTCLPCYETNFTHVCISCQIPIGSESKDMCYKDFHWHESCFSCHKCKNSLVNLPFATNKNTALYCETCYHSEFSKQCDACKGNLMPGKRIMEYKKRQWHDDCFKCRSCNESVGTQPFIIPNDRDVYCVPCFEEKFATKCRQCGKILTSGGVTFKNESWHRECFVCSHCSIMLAGQKFASREERPYCASCFAELFAKRCTSCKKPITGSGGTRFITFESRHWHSSCFVCALCEISMAGKGFITDGEDIICPDCAEEKLLGGTKGTSEKNS